MIADLRTRIACIAKDSPHLHALLACGRRPSSYENLLNQVDETARWLASKGIGRADRVAVVMPNGPEMASLFLGVASLSTCAPLNPAYKPNEFEFYLLDLKPKLVIVDAALDSAVRGVARAMDIEIVELHHRDQGVAGSFDLGPPGEWATPDGAVDYARGSDVALVLHTSGTTSRPKIVPLTHENLCVSATNIAESLALTSGDRCLNIMPLFHVHGLVGALLSSLSVGASVVCTPGYMATEFFAWLAEFHPTWYTGVPTMHHGIVMRAEDNRSIIAAHPLRFIRSCSSALAPKLMAQLEKAFSVPVIEAYGMTEAAHQMSSNGLPPRKRKPGSVGRPAGVEVAIMDDAGTLLPAGVEGEVVIRGPNVTRGYEHNPEANLKSFTNGWFRTGDQGRFDGDGDLFLTGRIKELILRGGEKISPREIDEVLLSHPAVEQALAFAVPDEALGERVAAAVVLKTGVSAGELELCEYVAGRLAAFKAPERIIFLEELPKGSTGKTQRIGLAERLGLSGLDKPQTTRRVEYCAPRNVTEIQLAEMWRAVLKLERAGVHDNFFDAGGDSILASQLIARLRQAFAVELSAPRLFQLPTIAELAEFVRGQENGNAAGIALPAVNRTEGVLLTSAQQRMWYFAQLEPVSAVYNRPFAYRLKGKIDPARLRASLSAVVRRHEILRTNYIERDGAAFGVVRDAYPVQLAITDLKGQSTEQWMREESARPFNLEVDPVLRCTLARNAPVEHVLLVVLHHIACDASTEALIMDDLAQAYNGTLADAPCPQYADYAAWQTAREAAVREEELAWWKRQLQSMDDAVEIAADFPRPVHNRYEGDSVAFELDAGTLDRCKAVARESKTTVFSVLLAAFDALLNRYTGAEEIVVGTPVAVRNHPAAQSMVGLFINTLALRTSAAGDPTFREFLERVRDTVAGGLDHQETPFDTVVDAVRRGRDRSRSTLFQIMFEYRNIDKPHLAMEGVLAERMEFYHGAIPFDLILDMEPCNGGLHGHFYYNTGLFERTTIERLARHFETLLGDALQSPGKKLSQLRLNTDEERTQMLVEWNATERAYPREIPLAALLEEQVERTPDAVAAVDGAQRLTYRELNERANQLAHELRKHGAGPDQLVGLCVERSTDMIVALLAIVKAGAAYLPLDPMLPAERLLFMMEDSGIRLLVTEQCLSSKLPVLVGATILLEDSSWQANRGDNVAVGVRPEHLAYVIYTSGSTGKPKGVQVPRGALTNHLWTAREWLRLSERDRVLSVSTISFDIASLEIWLALMVGAKLVVASRESAADGNALADLLEKHGITFLQATPVTWRLLFDSGWGGKPDLMAVSGGEAMPPEVAKQLVPAVKEAWNLYGPTETTIYSTGYRMTDGQATIHIGRPFANTQCYILDGQGQPAPVGVMGELYIGGEGLARGYLNRAELTAEKFIANPFRAGEARMYRTGDMARYRADGNIVFLGRIDQQVKIRGYRIELGEVEAALQEQAEIKQAVALAREYAPGDKRLVAYLVASDGMMPASSELQRRLKQRLPDYMVPTAYVFIDQLPISPNGKIDLKALAMPEDMADVADEEDFASSSSPVEQQLAGIWADVLKRKSTGIRENFFDIGGHSLSAMRVGVRIRSVFGIEIPISCLFQSPTIESLAIAIDGIRASKHSEQDLLRLLDEIDAMPASHVEGD